MVKVKQPQKSGNKIQIIVIYDPRALKNNQNLTWCRLSTTLFFWFFSLVGALASRSRFSILAKWRQSNAAINHGGAKGVVDKIFCKNSRKIFPDFFWWPIQFRRSQSIIRCKKTWQKWLFRAKISSKSAKFWLKSNFFVRFFGHIDRFRPAEYV